MDAKTLIYSCYKYFLHFLTYYLSGLLVIDPAFLGYTLEHTPIFLQQLNYVLILYPQY